jgi:hypothetical protein
MAAGGSRRIALSGARSSWCEHAGSGVEIKPGREMVRSIDHGSFRNRVIPSAAGFLVLRP